MVEFLDTLRADSLLRESVFFIKQCRTKWKEMFARKLAYPLSRFLIYPVSGVAATRSMFITALVSRLSEYFKDYSSAALLQPRFKSTIRFTRCFDVTCFHGYQICSLRGKNVNRWQNANVAEDEKKKEEEKEKRLDELSEELNARRTLVNDYFQIIKHETSSKINVIRSFHVLSVYVISCLIDRIRVQRTIFVILSRIIR